MLLLRFNKPVIDAPPPESLTKTTISVSTLLDSSMDKPLKENGWDSLLKVLQRHTIERYINKPCVFSASLCFGIVQTWWCKPVIQSADFSFLTLCRNVCFLKGYGMWCASCQSGDGCKCDTLSAKWKFDNPNNLGIWYCTLIACTSLEFSLSSLNGFDSLCKLGIKETHWMYK